MIAGSIGFPPKKEKGGVLVIDETRLAVFKPVRRRRADLFVRLYHSGFTLSAAWKQAFEIVEDTVIVPYIGFIPPVKR